MTAIIQAPNKVLSNSAKKYPLGKDVPSDKNLTKLLSDMETALTSARDPKGVGLAAPQIGAPYSIFIVKPTEKSKVAVFINPEILSTSDKRLAISKVKNPKLAARNKGPKRLEGCLSLLNIWGEVKRPEALTLSYYDELGVKHTKKFKGFLSTIIGHEVDHLQGILFPRRVLEQKGQLYKSHKNAKGEDEFDPIEV